MCIQLSHDIINKNYLNFDENEKQLSEIYSGFGVKHTKNGSERFYSIILL